MPAQYLLVYWLFGKIKELKRKVTEINYIKIYWQPRIAMMQSLHESLTIKYSAFNEYVPNL